MFSVLDSEVKFRAPFGAIICGPTMSGKSVFVSQLIAKRNEMIDKPIPRVVYCYGEPQPAFNDIQAEFFKGLDEVFESDNFFDPSIPTLLILDDLGQEMANHPRASKLFTQGIHHRNVSVILIMQNLYKQGKSMRDVQLNCQYFVLFRNCRDVQQIKRLATQTGMTHLPAAYEKITSEPYQPIVIDLWPNTPNYLRIRSHVLPGQDMHIYVKSGDVLPCRKTLGS